jgi:hypothetical protein
MNNNHDHKKSDPFQTFFAQAIEQRQTGRSYPDWCQDPYLNQPKPPGREPIRRATYAELAKARYDYRPLVYLGPGHVERDDGPVWALLVALGFILTLFAIATVFIFYGGF